MNAFTALDATLVVQGAFDNIDRPSTEFKEDCQNDPDRGVPAARLACSTSDASPSPFPVVWSFHESTS